MMKPSLSLPVPSAHPHQDKTRRGGGSQLNSTATASSPVLGEASHWDVWTDVQLLALGRGAGAAGSRTEGGSTKPEGPAHISSSTTPPRGARLTPVCRRRRRARPTWITLPYWITVPSSFLFSVSFCFFSRSAACCARRKAGHHEATRRPSSAMMPHRGCDTQPRSPVHRSLPEAKRTSRTCDFNPLPLRPCLFGFSKMHFSFKEFMDLPA